MSRDGCLILAEVFLFLASGQHKVRMKTLQALKVDYFTDCQILCLRKSM